MTIAILQTLFAALACYGLWRFVRALTEHSNGRGRASRIVTAGFLIRAFASEVLFWISWLNLPVARPLQLGDGLWFFALDGQWYLGNAGLLLHRGPKAILFISTHYASRIFTQWFTVVAGACGVVASTAILFNCVLYLATCALIFRIGRQNDRARDFALAAIALGPATILWSLQLLKDTFFVFLIVAVVAIWSEWQKLWRGDNVLRRVLPIAICGVAMCYAVYAIAGTRWYVGALVTGASLLFLGLVANLPRPRFAASAVGLLLFVTLAQTFLLGGEFDVPLQVRSALDVGAMFHPKAQAETAKLVLTRARRGFETTPGNTMIAPGPALASTAPVVVPAPPKRAEAEVPAPAALPVETKHISAGLFEPAKKVVTPPPPPPMIASAAAPPAPATPSPTPAPVVTATVAPVVTETVAPIAKAAEPEPPQPEAKPAPALESRTPSSAPPRVNAATAAPDGGRGRPRLQVKAAPVKVVPVPVKAVPVAPPAPVVVEQSLVSKIATDAAAMFVPRVVGQALGLVRIGGGRGFWLFADFDTLVFDLVVFLALAMSLRAIVRRERRVTPLFVLVLLIFAGLTGPMIYTVTNFGTLFRLREMVYVLAALLPLTLDLRTPEPAPDESR